MEATKLTQPLEFQEEWAKITAECCVKLVEGYFK